MIKRYDPALEYIGTGEYLPDMEERADGDYVALDDHESAIAAKDAEIAELNHYVAQLVAASTAIAEQVRERLLKEFDNNFQDEVATAIRTADLSDITGKD